MLDEKISYFGVFWGAFDPPTEAHAAIIEAALKLKNIHHLLIVINNTSYKNYSLPLNERRQLLQRAIHSVPQDRYTLLEQDDAHPMNYLALSKITSLPLCAIAGYDAYSKWAAYSHAEERAHYRAIGVVPRGDEPAILFDAQAFLLPIDESLRHIRSSDKRRNLGTQK